MDGIRKEQQIAVAPQNTTMAMVLAEQAKAVVQARCVMALKNPRNWDDVRSAILKECKRPGFSDAAIYKKPIGGDTMRGFSVRFAEAFLRHLKNVMPETVVISDTDECRLIRVSVTDLETNVTYSHDCIVAKTVERSRVRDGQEVLGQRQNSNGRVTYIVRATEDDMLMKCGSVESKALRTLVMRIVPGDLQDECWELLEKTARDNAAKDPDGERKKLVDSFSGVGVTATELELYLGRPLGQLAPADLGDLRQVFAAIKSGESRWLDFVDQDGARKGKEDQVADIIEKAKAKGPATAPAYAGYHPKPPKAEATAPKTESNKKHRTVETDRPESYEPPPIGDEDLAQMRAELAKQEEPNWETAPDLAGLSAKAQDLPMDDLKPSKARG